MLTIECEEGSPPVLHISGELDMATADQLRGALSSGLARDRTLVLDMSGVTFADAIGIRVILEAAESLNGRGPLTIVNAPRVERLLRLVGLSEIPSLSIRDGE
jgi:anti-sigma B factor antagonist